MYDTVDTLLIHMIYFDSQCASLICTVAKDGSPKAKGTGLKKGGYELDGPAQLIYPVCDDIPLIRVIHT
mgnify:CR=1 FL=1